MARAAGIFGTFKGGFVFGLLEAVGIAGVGSGKDGEAVRTGCFFWQ